MPASTQPALAAASRDPGSVVRGVTQFLAGFIGPMKAFKAAGAGTVPAAAGAGAISDFLGQAGDDATVAELVQSVPMLANPLAEFMSSQPGDSEAVKRLKNAVEGLGIGVLADGLMKGLQLVRAARHAKAQEGAASLPNQLEAPALDPARDFLLLGDPNGPLIEVRPNTADNVPAAQNRLAEGAAATETGVPGDVTAKGLVGAVDGRVAGYFAGKPRATAYNLSAEEWRQLPSQDARFVVTRDGKRFLGAGDGTADFAVLPAIEARGTLPARSAMPVRVRRMSLKHIDNDLHRADAAALGYRDGLDLLTDVTSNFDEIRAGRDGRVMLVKRTPAAEGAAHGVVVTELQRAADGNYWDVVTLGQRQSGQLGELLWAREHTSALPAGSAAPPRNPSPETGESGSLASGHSSSPNNIGPDQVYINFARIDAADDVKEALQEMADAFKGDIDEARRGVRSNEATQEAADALGMTVEDVLARRQGQGFNAEEALAARRLLTASGEKLLEAARKAAAPGAGPADQFVFRKMMATHYAIQAEVIGARTETARALQAGCTWPLGAITISPAMPPCGAW